MLEELIEAEYPRECAMRAMKALEEMLDFLETENAADSLYAGQIIVAYDILYALFG